MISLSIRRPVAVAMLYGAVSLLGIAAWRNIPIELLPNIAWNKGDAVRWIVEDVETHARQKTWCIFFGDDVTDEDAFRAVRDGVTVVVGQRPSLARLRLNSPADVAAVLSGVSGENGHKKENGR